MLTSAYPGSLGRGTMFPGARIKALGAHGAKAEERSSQKALRALDWRNEVAGVWASIGFVNVSSLTKLQVMLPQGQGLVKSKRMVHKRS